MDAEAERPVVLVFRDSRTTADQERAVRDTWRASARRDYAGWAEANSCRTAASGTSRPRPCRSPW